MLAATDDAEWMSATSRARLVPVFTEDSSWDVGPEQRNQRPAQQGSLPRDSLVKHALVACYISSGLGMLSWNRRQKCFAATPESVFGSPGGMLGGIFSGCVQISE